MRVGLFSRTALAAALCMSCMNVLAAVATYEFEGFVTSVINRGEQPLPASIAPGARFSGVAVIDFTLPTDFPVDERLIDLRIRFESGELLAVDRSQNPHGVSLLTSMDLDQDPPHYELVSIQGRTAPRPDVPDGVFMAVGWSGEPGAARQFPPQGEDFDLSDLIPQQRWRVAWNTSTSSVASGTIATFRKVPTSDFRLLSFDTSSLEGLMPLSGIWTVTNGALRSSSNQASSIALYQPLAMGEIYEIAASIHSEWSAPGNRSGFVYDYVDARNYREARVSLGSDPVGTLLLTEIVNGVRSEVARKTIPLAGDFRNARLVLTRDNDLVIFGVNVQSSLYVRQAPRPAATRLGLMTSWNLARFDDVALYRVTTQ